MCASASPYASPSSRQIAFDRSSVMRLVEVAEARVDVRAPEQRVGLDGGKTMLPRPRELFLQEVADLVARRPREDDRSPDLVPGVDLATNVPGRDRVLACSAQRNQLRTPITGGQLSHAHHLPTVGEVALVADALEDGEHALRGRA